MSIKYIESESERYSGTKSSKIEFKLVHRSLPYYFVSATDFDVHTQNTRHPSNIRTLNMKHKFTKK